MATTDNFLDFIFEDLLGIYFGFLAISSQFDKFSYIWAVLAIKLVYSNVCKNSQRPLGK